MSRCIFYSTVFLISISIVMVYSLSTYVSLSFGYSPTHFLQRQILAAFIAILLMWVVSNFNMDNFLSWFGWFLLGLSMVCIVAIPFLPESYATSAGGAKRWIRLGGFSLAPLEFFKIGFIFFLAWSFSRKFSYTEKLTTLAEIKRFLPHLVVFVSCMAVVVIFQNDFGQVVLLALTMCLMLIFSGGSFRTVALLFLFALACGAVIIALSPHRIDRMMSWWAGAQDIVLSIFPESISSALRVEDFPEPYQIFNAGNAIWNGGFLGNGLGEGIVKLGYLSEVHTDMILAGIAEELGFVGILILIAVFFVGIVFQVLRVASRTQNQSQSLLCLGAACLLLFSFLMNALGVTGLIPLKGIAVPLLSYGGSSLIANCLMLGIVLGIAKKLPQ